jgi:CRISPR/Cas system CSM-associated protein Csm3 (group 7 of RAMP superfamily)
MGAKMKVHYKIVFLDFWHMGSGVSSGGVYDSVVIKDRNDLPFVPGKTIKGLVREIAEMAEDEVFVLQVCGNEKKGASSYFADATLPKEVAEAIVANDLQSYLYDVLSFTAINEKGVAKDNSLREIEVAVPLELEGFVEVEDEHSDSLKRYLRSIKRMGLSRNRGFGRCRIEIKDGV